MGAFTPPSQIPFFLITTVVTILITPSIANDNNNDSRNTNNYLSPAPANANANSKANYTPFKSSIPVIVCVLTTVFSIAILLLLYAKHCKGENGVVGHANHHSGITPSSTTRKNSGIDRGVIESLPIFRFGALRGQKDGLECAVCLTKFEPIEVLRLLPKCKHAFHVECVDTWLDGHSTCPLCRYRVDPEDILLIEDAKISVEKTEPEPELVLKPEFRRVSGRHSSAGEFRSSSQNPTSFRRSLDGAACFKKRDGESASVSVGCFDRPRKDGLLLPDGLMTGRKSCERRFEHRIIISAGGGGGFHRRWSDVQPSDLLYIRSEMLISDSRRFSSGSSRPSVKRQQMLVQQQRNSIGGDGSGSDVINSRSVSEITGLSRFSRNGECNNNNFIVSNGNDHRQRHAGLVSRWLAWISSRSLPQPAVRSDRTPDIGNIV